MINNFVWFLLVFGGIITLTAGDCRYEKLLNTDDSPSTYTEVVAG